MWQDVTAEVKSGANIVFKNKTAVNGAAFNFRITVERGHIRRRIYLRREWRVPVRRESHGTRMEKG